MNINADDAHIITTNATHGQERSRESVDTVAAHHANGSNWHAATDALVPRAMARQFAHLHSVKRS